MTTWLMIWLASVIVTSVLAAAKNRSALGWFFMGLFFGPLAVLLIAVSPTLEPPGRRPQARPMGPIPEELEILKQDFEMLRRRLNDLGGRVAALSPAEEQPAAAPKTAAAAQAQAAPSPREFEHAVAAKTTAPKSDIETDLGRYWLNKIGIVVFSLGVAFLLTYSFAHFGPVAKVSAGYVIALAFFLAGIKLERHATYANFGLVLLGGAWAITYFTTYAMHHFEASRVIDSRLVDLCLLALVAAGIIAHSLRYRSEALTAMAILTGYLTSVLGDIGSFTLVSAGLLACVVLVTVARMGWVRLIFLGILATYLTHAVWVAKQIAALGVSFPWWKIDNIVFFFNMAFLSIYAALFAAAAHIVRDRGPGVAKKLAAANLANFLLFFIMAFPKVQASYPAHAFNFVFGLGIIYMIAAAAMQIVRRDDLFVSDVVIAVSLLTLSLPLRFLPYHAVLIWCVELPFLVFAGFAFERRIYRYLGLGLVLYLLLRVLLLETPSGIVRVFGTATTWDVVLQFMGSLACAACYGIYWFYARKKDAPEPDAPLRNVYALLTTVFLTLYAWSVIDPKGLVPGLCLESLLLFAAGALLLDRTVRTLALWVLALAAARTVFPDGLGPSGGGPRLTAAYGLVGCAAVQYALLRLLTAKSLLKTDETWTGRLIFFAGAGFFALAILEHAPLYAKNMDLGMLALCVMWWGARIADKPIRLFALAALLLTVSRFVFLGEYAVLAPLALWAVAAAHIVCAYAVYFIYRDAGKRSLLDGDEKGLLTPLFTVSTFLFAYVIRDQIADAWLALALGVAGVLLFATGFLIREKIFRLAGFILFGLALAKVVFIDLTELALLYKIISFIILGALFLGVSLIYTRTAPERPDGRTDARSR